MVRRGSRRSHRHHSRAPPDGCGVAPAAPAGHGRLGVRFARQVDIPAAVRISILVVFATPEQRRQVGDLREAFEESNLPFRVDLLVWEDVPDSFRRRIEAAHVTLFSTTEGTDRTGWRHTHWRDLVTLEYGRSLRRHDRAGGAFRVFGTNGPIGWHDEALSDGASVIVGRKGAYRGVHYSPSPCFVIDTAFCLKPKTAIDVRWAYYTLLTHDINGLDSGSAIPSTSREDFYGLPVSVPPPTEQRAIAHILGTLDDKIELNRRMTATLDALVRALFKSGSSISIRYAPRW